MNRQQHHDSVNLVEIVLTQPVSKGKIQSFGGEDWLMPKVGKIYKERGTRWYIRLTGGIQIHCDKNHITFNSKTHAQSTLIKIAGEIENGTFDPSFYAKKKKSLLSFSVYATEWLGGCEKKMQRDELSPTYLRDLRRFVYQIFIPYFQDKNILEIRGRELKAFYLSLEHHPKTVKNIMAVLNKMFRDAVYEEIIPTLPNFPRQGKIPKPQRTFLTEEQQMLVLEQMSPEDQYATFFAMAHGVRAGEVRALKHKDIDLVENTVFIRRAVSGLVLRDMTKQKTDAKIPLNQDFKTMYLERPRVIDPEGFVFTKNGKMLSQTWLSKRWREAADKAGFPNVCFHEGTRHSLGSQAGNRHVPINIIGAMLRHSTLEVTKQYTHLNTDALKPAERRPETSPILTLKKQIR